MLFMVVEKLKNQDGKAVYRKLRDKGVAHGTDLQWRLLARETNTASQLKVGEYALDPALTPRELLETSMIWSVAGLIERGGLTRDRPFRSPHHTISDVIVLK